MYVVFQEEFFQKNNYIMNYLNLVKKIAKVNKGQIYNLYSTEALLRILAWPLTPFFYYLKIKPNSISLIALITGIAGSVVILLYGNEFYAVGIIIYVTSILFDHCDGNIARLRNIPTFFGRFMDGLFDIIVTGFIQIALLSLIIRDILDSYPNQSLNYFLSYEIHIILIMAICFLSLFSTAMQHMIPDRFGGYCRWINEQHNLKLKPNLREDVSFKFVDFLNDMQLVFIILGYFSNQFIFIYFLINLLTSIIMIIFYFYFAKKRMDIHANDHRTYLSKK